MSPLLAALLTAVLFSRQGHGKTVAGLFKSESARHHNGQFITRFMYQGSVNDDDDGGGDANYDDAVKLHYKNVWIEINQDLNCAYSRESSNLSVLTLSCPSLSLLQTLFIIIFVLQMSQSNQVHHQMFNIHSHHCSINSRMNTFRWCPNGPTSSCVIFVRWRWWSFGVPGR